MLNQIVLVGRLTRNVSVNKASSGVKVATLSLAIPRSFKNSEGNYDTDFIDCVIFDNIAENTKEYCKFIDDNYEEWINWIKTQHKFYPIVIESNTDYFIKHLHEIKMNETIYKNILRLLWIQFLNQENRRCFGHLTHIFHTTIS